MSFFLSSEPDDQKKKTRPRDYTFVPGGTSWTSWLPNAKGEWTWRGDPTIHGVGETQGSDFNPETGENYNPEFAKFFPRSPTAGELAAQGAAQNAARQSEEQRIASQGTARTLELLRQQLGQGSRYETENLRRNLSQRGLLDSGSLGAGLGRINENYGRQMAAGTMAAANREGDTLLSLMAAQKAREQQEKEMQLRKYLAERGYETQLEAARISASHQPSGPDSWASALGSFAGVLAPELLPFLAGLGNSDSEQDYKTKSYTKRA